MSSMMKRLSFVASTASLGLLLMIGCGVEQSPLAQDSDADVVALVEGGRSGTFPAPGLEPAAKNLTADLAGSRVAVSTIGPDGGSLRIAANGPDNAPDNVPDNVPDIDGQLVVTFDVPEGALDQDETTTMRVLGHRLREGLDIIFGPSGLLFSNDATVTVSLEMGLYSPGELAGLTVKHWDDDGNFIELIVPDVEVDGGGTLTIGFGVSGFSRYSLP